MINFKEIFAQILPTFLFKWDGEIEITPDLNEVKNYCSKNNQESFLLHNFKNIAKYLTQVDLNDV